MLYLLFLIIHIILPDVTRCLGSVWLPIELPSFSLLMMWHNANTMPAANKFHQIPRNSLDSAFSWWQTTKTTTEESSSIAYKTNRKWNIERYMAWCDLGGTSFLSANDQWATGMMVRANLNVIIYKISSCKTFKKNNNNKTQVSN